MTQTPSSPTVKARPKTRKDGVTPQPDKDAAKHPRPPQTSGVVSAAFTKEQAEDFATLFKGNSTGYGQRKAKSDDFYISSGCASPENYKRHLDGHTAIGVAPICSDNNCIFGCIDDDEHHETGAPVDIVRLEKLVREHKLPLVTCRSRTGGVHLYAFFSKPVQAARVRGLLSLWASELQIQDVAEVFPKQIRVSAGGFGNMITLPYFNAKDTKQYALSQGNPQPLSAFLDLCSNAVVSPEEVDKYLGGEHRDAPPCLQHIIQRGCNKGNRNEAMYNLTIYMKRRSPDTYKDDLVDLNRSVFEEPLAAREARRTVQSASRSDYKYRCNEAPCKSFCNRDLCVTRKFGIDPMDYEEPIETTITGLRKHLTQPIQWELTVRSKTVFVATTILMDYRRLMVEVTEAAGFVLPGMKNAEWLRIVAPLIETAPVVAAPVDSTAGGLLLSRLNDFVRRARTCTTETGREPLLRGQPIAETPDGEHSVVHFQGKDFVEYLKRKRHGEIRSNVVWITLKRSGVVTGRLRVGQRSVTVWSVQVDINDESQAVPKFEIGF